MTREHEFDHPEGSDALNPVFIAQLASRIFNEAPAAGNVPKSETDVTETPSQFSVPARDPSVHNRTPDRWHEGENHDWAGIHLQQSKEPVPEYIFRGNPHEYYFLETQQENEPEPLEHHANKLTEQQSYSENKSGSYGLEEALQRDNSSGRQNPGIFPGPAPKGHGGSFPYSDGLPGDNNWFYPATGAQPSEAADDLQKKNPYLPETAPGSYSPEFPENHAPASPGSPGEFEDGSCYAEQLYRGLTGERESPELSRIFQSLKRYAELANGDLSGTSSPGKPQYPGKHAPAGTATHGPDLYPGREISRDPKSGLFLNPFELTSGLPDNYYFVRGSEKPLDETDLFDVATIRRDFPVLHQKIHGRDLVWFDNAATTQKPWSVINAVADFYARDNSNIHRGAHTLAARSTDAYEGTREKVRQFIGASSTTEIIFVRGTTEGINLVAQTWGRRFLQPGDEIVLSILEHHANIVPWQMVAKETGARIRVIPVNDRGEILLEEYTRLIGPRTRFVSLTHASNGLGTILPVREMIRIAKRFDVKVLVDGAQSVAHIPVNVQELDADFFVFSGHKIFAPTGIGVVYGKREVLENMPPWQGGGNMIRDVRFEETVYNEVPARFEAGTPSVADAVGLGAALDYVRKIGLENISRYEHELTKYAAGRLQEIPGLRLIGTAADKVGVLSFVLNNLPNEEVGKLLDQEGIAVRAGHHCTQPSLRRFGVEGTVRPSLAFYNTREEIDRLADALRHIQRR
ncbi:MAG: cysteine desulfurase [Chlorobiaceae bacterium]|nr:cysteine desulfurase [Chlorobiaceae bacterium]